MKLVLAFLMMMVTSLGFASEEATVETTPSTEMAAASTEGSTEASTPVVTEVTKPVSEEQIPININQVKKSSTSDSYMGRLVMVVAVMAVFAGGAFFYAKKYGHPGKNQQTQIKVLTQHYLGPKKSLAIVRVAGESILIGVTDNSINLIKSLSLLDDEIPEQTQPNFEKAMQDQEKVQQAGSEEFSIRHITDVVSLKLKGMRNDL